MKLDPDSILRDMLRETNLCTAAGTQPSDQPPTVRRRQPERSNSDASAGATLWCFGRVVVGGGSAFRCARVIWMLPWGRRWDNQVQRDENRESRDAGRYRANVPLALDEPASGRLPWAG